LTAKITNFKIIKSGVAEIQHFQAREYSLTLWFFVLIAPDINSQMNLKNKIKNLQQLQPKSSQSIASNLIANNSINLASGNRDINITGSNVSSINGDLNLNSMQVRN
jgi:hypothetical protein